MNRRKRWCILPVLFVLFLLSACGKEQQAQQEPEQSPYRIKADLLKAEYLTEQMALELGNSPAGKLGHVVFLSVCDTVQRARVYTGVGTTLEEAWDAADQKAAKAVEEGLDPVWVKSDVLYLSRTISMEELKSEILASRQEFFRYGLAFDQEFQTALLEAELNGAKIYEYENGGIDLEYLNLYLEGAGRQKLEKLPQECVIFRCFGRMCDENNTVYPLYSTSQDYGRRKEELIDDKYVENLIVSASEFLLEQVNEDGTFVYGYYPRFDNAIENYNIVRHASTIWSLICRYRILPSKDLEAAIDKTIEYMLSQVRYENDETAYLYEAKDDEIKLGANGVAVVAMTEYMDVFQNDKYVDVCRHLGNGILSMLDQETGQYYHVLNGDFTTKEAFRTVYYDGEATFALCRLYSLTGEQVWLDAAQSAVDRFIAADYAQHKDHWVAYSMNEITKHVTDRGDYYLFALQNAQKNLQAIYQRDTTYHTYLELLMATFEVYDRLVAQGSTIEGFHKEDFLKTIYHRADHMLNGYFYPEYAMYMENPQRILNTFMVRHDGYRVRIDDVQHNIGGYYLYYKNYGRLVEHGMLECRD